MNEHIPGPWETYLNSLNDVVVRKMSGHGIDRYEVCVIAQKIQYKNARLIAASPELLEALQSIVDCCDEDHTARDYSSRQNEIRSIARLAIAKATGEMN